MEQPCEVGHWEGQRPRFRPVSANVAISICDPFAIILAFPEPPQASLMLTAAHQDLQLPSKDSWPLGLFHVSFAGCEMSSQTTDCAVSTSENTSYKSCCCLLVYSKVCSTTINMAAPAERRAQTVLLYYSHLLYSELNRLTRGSRSISFQIYQTSQIIKSP